MDNDQNGIRPIDELNQLSAHLESVNELAELKPIFARVEEIAKQNAGATDIELAVKQVKTQLVNRGKKLKEAGAIGTVSSPLPSIDRIGSTPPTPSPYAGRHELDTGPVIPIPTLPSGENPARGSGQGPSYPPPPQFPPPQRPTGAMPTGGSNVPQFGPPPPPTGQQRPTAGVFAVPQATGQQLRPPQGGLNWKRAMLIGAAIGLVGAVGILITIVKIAQGPKPPKPDPKTAGLNITTVPPGAKIQINGEDKCTSPCSLQLSPGDYRITAQLEGYDATLLGETLISGQAARDVTMSLNSQAQSLRIFSDIAGKVQLDGKPAGDIAEGSFIQDRVPAGPHTVSVAGVGADASFSFEVSPGKAPVIKGPTTAHNLLAILVSSSGTQARMQASTGPLKTQLDSKDQTPIAATGTDFPSVPNGDHELVVGEGKDLKKIQVSFLPTPTLTAYLRSDVNAGNLVVATNPPEDDVTVYLNGRPQVRKTTRGQFRIQLPPGNSNVRVSKDGFADVGEQVAVVKKGEDTKVEFRLKSLPRVSTLRIKAVTSGASIFLDGREIGKVGADGTFQTGGVAPGEHEIEFRLAGFNNKKDPRNFKAGEAVEIANVSLIPAVGVMQLTISPGESRITLKHENDLERVVTNPVVANLPPGRYTVTGKAPGYKENQKLVIVAPGQTTAVDMTLVKDTPAVVIPTVKPGSISDFDPAWERDGELYTHAGSSIAFRIIPALGTFHFKIQLLKGGNAFGGGKKVRWVLGFADGSHTLVELEKSKFRRTAVLNGKPTKNQAEFKLQNNSDIFDVEIIVTPTKVTHRIGGIMVDQYTEAPNLTNGKFVFIVNANEQIGVSGFSFTPAR